MGHGNPPFIGLDVITLFGNPTHDGGMTRPHISYDLSVAQLVDDYRL